MTYNKSRHLELGKRFLEFKKQGKSLFNLATEKPDEYEALSDYMIALEDHIFWEKK